MRNIVLSATLALGTALAPSVALPHEYYASNFTLIHPWAEATAPGATTAAVYFRLEAVRVRDRLLRVDTPYAEHVELRPGDDAGAPALASIDIEPAETIDLSAGHPHLLLRGLNVPLQWGPQLPDDDGFRACRGDPGDGVRRRALTAVISFFINGQRGRHAVARPWPSMDRDASFLRAWAGEMRYRYRSVWISDIHLGTPGCQAGKLLDFLRRVDCDTLFLVGDIVDGWQLRRQWFWPQAHNDVVQKLLRKARKGTRVIFVPGNHDEFARRYIGHDFGGIEVAAEWTHRTADGRTLWVTHGDHFDGVVQCARWLAVLGDRTYGVTLTLSRHLNSLRARMGLPYWSLSRYLKHKVKRAVSYVGDYERALVHEAKKRGVDGVVCGHIHHAELRMIDGIVYANDGDWVESLTALAERDDGRLEIVEWAERMGAPSAGGRRGGRDGTCRESRA